MIAVTLLDLYFHNWSTRFAVILDSLSERLGNQVIYGGIVGIKNISDLLSMAYSDSSLNIRLLVPDVVSEGHALELNMQVLCFFKEYFEVGYDCSGRLRNELRDLYNYTHENWIGSVPIEELVKIVGYTPYPDNEIKYLNPYADDDLPF